MTHVLREVTERGKEDSSLPRRMRFGSTVILHDVKDLDGES